jgi:glycogen operon protein
VVYNHSAEGNHLGPMLSLKGIDNLVYYRQPAGALRYYLDYTGCGNSLSVLHPRTLQLIMDSLRYWVLEMHVDGFRFDLATTLARGLRDADRLSTFFDIIHQDPVLSQVKLIAEPWDIGPGGYQVGNFPVLWAEWNGKYRDAVRRFWKGEPVSLAEMAYRLTGSSDLYRHNGRRPYASINFVTAHDGFTLRDLVSYNHKHNQANGEDNRDGENHNNSFNHGVEGPTANQAIVELRARQQRNFLATLLLSQGVPMLLAGDERSRTQSGNNNAYCQDSPIGWIDWSLDDLARTQLEWTRRLIRLRREHPALQRRRFFQDRSIHGRRVREVEWFGPDGRELSEAVWFEATVGPLGMLLNGQEMDEMDEQGQQLHDDILLLLLNPGSKALRFTLPSVPGGATWEPLLDSAKPDAQSLPTTRSGTAYRMLGRSLALLRLVMD